MNTTLPHALLIAPPQVGLLDGFISGLHVLAGYVRRRFTDISVAVLDFTALPVTDVREQLRAHLHGCSAAVVVGVTTTTATYQAALQVARAVKSMRPSAIVVFGGPHASADPQTILRRHSNIIDCIVIGEGERSFSDLLASYPDITRAAGVGYLRDGTYHQNPAPPLLEEADLDLIPVCADDIPTDATPGKFGHITYVSARGCPLACAFCSVANQRVRAKSVERVAADICELVERGYTNIAIEDNFFAHSPSRTRAICDALARLQAQGVAFRWDCQTRLESIVLPDLIDKLERAGCDAVYLGVESLIPEHLVFLNKTARPDRYLRLLDDRAIPDLLSSDIAPYINLQLGLPGEREDHHAATINHIQWLGRLAAARKKTITIFPQLFVVYPGTLHHQQCVSRGDFAEDIFEEFTEWEDDQRPVRSWLGEHFAHGTGGLPLGILERDALGRGTFVISADPVFRISTTLHTLAGLDGVQVFQYGPHIVKA